MKKVVTYHFRGQVERPYILRGKLSYVWRDAYSETSEAGGVIYPWMTVTECLTDAKNRGARAVFEEN